MANFMLANYALKHIMGVIMKTIEVIEQSSTWDLIRGLWMCRHDQIEQMDGEFRLTWTNGHYDVADTEQVPVCLDCGEVIDIDDYEVEYED